MDPDQLDNIIKGCKSGKMKDQEVLYREFSGILFSVCLYYSKDYTEAEDILHEGFMKIYQNISKYRYKGSFEGWMRRIMINTALEKFRKERHLHALRDIDDHEEDFSSNEIISDITAKDLIGLIQQLSPKYRMVFNLYAIEGYSHKEISKMMGISEGTSKSNLARARSILQKKVKKQFYSATKQVSI